MKLLLLLVVASSAIVSHAIFYYPSYVYQYPVVTWNVDAEKIEPDMPSDEEIKEAAHVLQHRNDPAIFAHYHESKDGEEKKPSWPTEEDIKTASEIMFRAQNPYYAGWLKQQKEKKGETKS